MNARSIISPEESAEIRLLRAEYFDASKRAAEAIQTGDTGLDGENLRLIVDEDARAARAMRRIKAIYGL
jgi:hypothetical protein